MKHDSSWYASQSLLVAICICVPAPPLAAQQTDGPGLALSGLLGTGMIDSEIGLTGGIGVAVAAPRYVVRALFDVHVLQPEDGDYQWELGSGLPQCRETSSGLLVDNSFCSTNRALTGANAEAGLFMPAFSGACQFGGGYRFGSGSTPYGFLGYGFNPEGGNVNLLFRVVAGHDLLGVQMVALLPTRPR